MPYFCNTSTSSDGTEKGSPTLLLTALSHWSLEPMYKGYNSK